MNDPQRVNTGPPKVVDYMDSSAKDGYGPSGNLKAPSYDFTSCGECLGFPACGPQAKGGSSVCMRSESTCVSTDKGRVPCNQNGECSATYGLCTSLSTGGQYV